MTMLTVHRQFGKLMKRSADDSQVSVLLKDFDQADKLLTRIIDSTKAWRDAWAAILMNQYRLTQEFEGLYVPIIGSSDPSTPSVSTDPATLARTNRLREEYEDLRRDLINEIGMVDQRMINPAMQAKDFLQPLKKTIKKRDDRKLDYEHFQSRVESSRKKTKRSDRDNAALVKAEQDLAKATEDYNSADDHLRTHLPGLLSATFSLLPHLLAAQIEIQNTLLAHYYTSLHNYCEQEQFPSPPPPWEEIIQDWEASHLRIQRDAERLITISGGKTGRLGRSSDDRRNGGHINGYTPRRPSNNRQMSSTSPGRGFPPPEPVMETKPRLGEHSPRIPAIMSTSNLSETSLTAPDAHSTLTPGTYVSAALRTDNFNRGRQPLSTSATLSPSYALSNQTSAPSSSTTAAIARKKPPPPPPPRANSASNFNYVTALYDFAGESEGDLAFREGDRIRVIKKTESTDDWWEGELRGVKGSFPANYCK